MLCNLVGCATNEVKVSGKLDYSKEINSPQETLRKAVELKYRKNIYETPDKKHLFYLGGKVYIDQDIFRNTSKVNTMTSLGWEF